MTKITTNATKIEQANHHQGPDIIFQKVFQPAKTPATIPFPSIVAIDLAASVEFSRFDEMTYKVVALGSADSGKATFLQSVIPSVSGVRAHTGFFNYRDIRGDHYRIWSITDQESSCDLTRFCLFNAYFALLFKEGTKLESRLSGRNTHFFRVNYHNHTPELTAINRSACVTANFHIQDSSAATTFDQLLDALHQKRQELLQNFVPASRHQIRL